MYQYADAGLQCHDESTAGAAQVIKEYPRISMSLSLTKSCFAFILF